VNAATRAINQRVRVLIELVLPIVIGWQKVTEVTSAGAIMAKLPIGSKLAGRCCRAGDRCSLNAQPKAPDQVGQHRHGAIHVLAGHGDQGVVAGHVMTLGYLPHLGFLAGAELRGLRAACPEAATRRRVDGRWQLAVVHEILVDSR
jgi:hypothetical protein